MNGDWGDDLKVAANLRTAEHARSLLARANYKVEQIMPAGTEDGGVAHEFEVELAGRSYVVRVQAA